MANFLDTKFFVIDLNSANSSLIFMSFCLLALLPLLCNIANTRESGSFDFQTPRKRVEKTRRSRVFFEPTSRCLKSDETPFRVFDIVSQIIDDSWRNP